ncbi:hypothetical protein [Mangrovibacterium diazotrophicum]|uniref:Uncharacterized protein n=1 Tax=Mangrovibacterium diazotrophicum TaxID=1261403 RepID=A0A419WA70_9BACT|nr:hypothetical protein [Mangrovibacterium diazotrophicum]RKD92302.1 hypothetical protein BC643_2673 [Mangrovibacterium diazotrophicum]
MIRKHVSNIFIALAMLLAVIAGGVYFMLYAIFSSPYSRVQAKPIEV